MPKFNPDPDQDLKSLQYLLTIKISRSEIIIVFLMLGSGPGLSTVIYPEPDFYEALNPDLYYSY